MDSALRHSQGLTVEQHRDQMAAMYARFSEIAAANPEAWSDQAVSAEHIREASDANRMLAFPYTKLHNSQWNVDQGAGLILCAARVAEELGIERDRWVFPRASAESNFMSVVASRADLGGCPGFRLAGQAVMEAAGIDFNDIRLRELYSCFPYAVRAQLQEFGMDGGGDLSVTGGMTFGAGDHRQRHAHQAGLRPVVGDPESWRLDLRGRDRAGPGGQCHSRVGGELPGRGLCGRVYRALPG
jgi:acetyl-CoA C-acetyltransferase